jgi:hypothetical protein
VEVDLPHTDYGLATYYIIAPAEASANLARYDGIRYGLSEHDSDVLGNYLATRGRGFGAEVKRRVMLGTYALSAGYYDAFYLKAQKVRTLIKADFDAAFGWVDALVAPTSPTVAFPLGARLADPSLCTSDACTLPVNIAGLVCRCPAGSRMGRRSAPVHRPLWDEEPFRLGRAYDMIRRPTAGAIWTARLAREDPGTPTPSSEWRRRGTLTPSERMSAVEALTRGTARRDGPFLQPWPGGASPACDDADKEVPPCSVVSMVGVSLGAALTATYLVAVRPPWRHWGVDPPRQSARCQAMIS